MGARERKLSLPGRCLKKEGEVSRDEGFQPHQDSRARPTLPACPRPRRSRSAPQPCALCFMESDGKTGCLCISDVAGAGKSTKYAKKIFKIQFVFLDKRGKLSFFVYLLSWW